MELKTYVRNTFVGGAVIALVMFAFGLGDIRAKRTTNELLAQVEITMDKIETVENKNRSLASTLKKTQAKNDSLLQTIASLGDQAASVEYVATSRGKLFGKPTLVVDEPPKEHLFRLDNGPAVARYSQSNKKYIFETFDLTFHADVAVAPKKTAMSLRVESDYEPGEEHEVPVTLEVTHIQSAKQKLFEPHIGVGITGSAPSLQVNPSATISFIHLTEALDIVGVYSTYDLNASRIDIGVSPASYNVGEHLPIFTDLWVTPGGHFDRHGKFQVDLTIGTKF